MASMAGGFRRANASDEQPSDAAILKKAPQRRHLTPRYETIGVGLREGDR